MIAVAPDVEEQQMKSRILASILVVACALSPAGGATTPFTLTLEAEENPIKAGSDVKVDIILRNSSNHAIDVSLGLAEMDYALAIGDSQNRIPPETELARKSKGHARFSNETVFTLQPGETLPKEKLVISKFYDVSRRGKYTIQVSRAVPKELGSGTVKSTAITITITD
jgi:hypothetical protein